MFDGQIAKDVVYCDAIAGMEIAVGKKTKDRAVIGILESNGTAEAHQAPDDMKHIWIIALAAILTTAVSCRKEPEAGTNPRVFQARGVIQELKTDGMTVVIKHEAISNYMAAMTMPFVVKQPQDLAGVAAGDEVNFRLLVTENESWIDQLTKTGKILPVPAKSPLLDAQTRTNHTFSITNIPDFALTNEFNQPVSLHGYKGKAVALTFFFTRCPLPEFCPRLSKNFEGASEKLTAMTNGPTNWQLLSVSFDPLDRPDVLRAYGNQYHYASNHWSFLTGNPEHIRELARGFGVSITNDGGSYSHDFATAVFDTNGQLRTLWRFGGDTTDLLVSELLKATGASK
jgi:protein SCO1/2